MEFREVSFRFLKEMHAESMKELGREEAKKTPLHEIFPLYVDLIVPKTQAGMKSTLGFLPLDEPLLTRVFEHKKYQVQIQLSGKNITIPSPSILLAMKVHAVAGRDKEHKKIKDLCDIIALGLYAGLDLETLQHDLHNLLGKIKIDMHLKAIDIKEVQKAAQILSIQEGIIKQLIERML